MYKIKKYGFTLAEVLITLVIIGVIAAITVPTLISNSNEQAIRSALRKNYSVIQQALERYYVDNGEHVSKSTKFGEDFFFKYFSLAKNCTIDDCNFGQEIKYKNYIGEEIDEWELGVGSKTGVMLSDGSYISYHYLDMGEDRYHKYAGDNPHWGISLYVDVNGNKSPNALGRDLFHFDIVLEYENGESGNSKIIPSGSEGDYYSEKKFCNKSNSDPMNGMGCTLKMLKDKSF